MFACLPCKWHEYESVEVLKLLILKILICCCVGNFNPSNGEINRNLSILKSVMENDS